jgi:hypothetical protein
MRLETANRYVGEFECIIQSIFSGAKYNYPTSAQLTEQLNIRVFNVERYKRLPDWAKNQIYIKWHSLRKNMIDKYVRLFYIGLDGRKIPTHKAWDLFTEEEKELCRATDGLMKIHHIWMKETVQLNDNGSELIILTPTDKVYWHAEME